MSSSSSPTPAASSTKPLSSSAKRLSPFTKTRVELRSEPGESPLTVVSGVIAYSDGDVSALRIANVYVDEAVDNVDYVDVPLGVYREFIEACDLLYYQVVDAERAARMEREAGQNNQGGDKPNQDKA